MKIDEFIREREEQAEFNNHFMWTRPPFIAPHRWALVEDDTGEVAVIDTQQRPREGESAAILYLPVDECGDCVGSIHIGRIYADHRGGFVLRQENKPEKHFGRKQTARCVILGRGWLLIGGEPAIPD